jgi:hypothetical protein
MQNRDAPAIKLVIAAFFRRRLARLMFRGERRLNSHW